MRLAFVGSDSPLLAEARALEAAGEVRVHEVPPGATALPPTTAEDQALLATSANPWFARDLLHRCQDGQLGDVRVIGDAGLPAPERLGFRWRPWLAGLHPLGDTAPDWVVSPAPVLPVRTLGEVPWTPPPVRLAEVPCATPPRLQVQTTTACRQGCPFCPHPGPDAEVGTMEESVYASLLGQLARNPPAHVELYLHAEPLEDPRLPSLARRARAACPEALVCIVTHERALTPARAAALAGSLHVVFASLDPGGGPWEARLERLAGHRATLLASGTQLVPTVLENLLPPGVARSLRRATHRHGLPLESFRATRRAGALDLDVEPMRRCTLPFHTAFVRYDGALVGCCEDWRFTRILGHLGDLAEIWQGPEARRLRRELLSGPLASPCDRCQGVS